MNDSISQYLASLGKTAGEVAANMYREGLRGFPGCTDCVIMNAVRRFCKEESAGLISPAPGILTYRDNTREDPVVPQPVAEFMEQFDRRKWPHLAW
jgi:hypothetical protein